MGEAHARLGPSNHRWPHCPGSPRVEALYPDVPGQAAIDGTGSHLLLELCLTEGRDPESYVGEIIGVNHDDNPNGWLVGKDRADRVKMCLAYIDRRKDELLTQFPGCTVTLESEEIVDPGGAFGRDDWWGTCDITLTATEEHKVLFVEVIDYKDGRGWVDVNNNTQLLGYLGGRLRPIVASGPELVRPFHPERVMHGCRMTIVQPKTNPVIRSQDLTTAEAIGHLEALAWAAQKTDHPDAPLIPDKAGGKGHCQWCKHKRNCTALPEASIMMIKTFESEEALPVNSENKTLIEVVQSSLGDLTALSPERLAELADVKPGIDALFEKVNQEIERRIETGVSVPGYTIAPGNGSNVWNDSEENITKMLKARKFKKDDIYPPKLISPAQVLKSELLTNDQKEKIKKEYITYKVGKPTLKKVAYNKVEKTSAKSIFDDVAEQPSKPNLSFL